MKQTIFNRGKGWYISCSNYKDENDKAYISLYFPKGTTPIYEDNGRGFSMLNIDILEAKFTSYQGKAGMTIFKYVESKNDESKKDDSKMFGAENIVEPDDLPFY